MDHIFLSQNRQFKQSFYAYYELFFPSNFHARYEKQHISQLKTTLLYIHSNNNSSSSSLRINNKSTLKYIYIKGVRKGQRKRQRAISRLINLMIQSFKAIMDLRYKDWIVVCQHQYCIGLRPCHGKKQIRNTIFATFIVPCGVWYGH